MKIRWKDILKNLDIDHEYEGVRYCPKWYGACPFTNKNLLESPNYNPILKLPTSNILEDSGNAEDISNNKDKEEENTDISINSLEINKHHSPQDVKTKDVDDISKALADAMLESSLCDKDKLDTSPAEPYCMDIQSPSLLSEDILVEDSDLEDVTEIPEDELFDNKVFPNPFLLSPEYVNMKESLYSMSENITSMDIGLMSSENALGGDSSVANLKLSIENSFLNETLRETEIKHLSNKTNDEAFKKPCLSEISDNNEILANSQLIADTHAQNNENDIHFTTTITRCNEDGGYFTTTATKEIDITATTKPPTIEFDKSSEIAVIDTVKDSTTISTTTKTATEFNGNVSSVETICDNKYVETDIPIFQLEGIEDSADIQQHNNNSCSENESEDSGNDEKGTHLLSINFENNYSRESLNGTEFESCPHVQSRKTSAATDDQVETRYIAKSPTGETLDKLPPWIAQMIRVSTPTSPREKKKTQLTDSDFEECLCQKTREELELKKEQIELNKELLGIVENANKFVKENMKTHNGCSTPKELMQNVISQQTTPENSESDSPLKPKDLAKIKTPTSKRAKEINESSFLSPISNSEASVFIQKTPSLKLVAENYGSDDQTDGEKLKLLDASEKKCPYCSFEPETSTKIVLPLSLGEEQLKFMEIQAQVSVEIWIIFFSFY